MIKINISGYYNGHHVYTRYRAKKECLWSIEKGKGLEHSK